MALKAVLASLDGVPEALQAEYKPGEGGKFYLDLEGLEDETHPAVGALVRAKKRESEGRGKAEATAKELREKYETLSTEMEGRLKGTIPKADVERLELSYKEKLATREKELTEGFTGQITALSGGLKTVLVDNVAKDIAAKLVKDAKLIPLILPHITPRLAVEMGADGRPTTRVLDRDGKPSASTLDDLSKEISANPMFADVLLGSRATGSGAEGGGHASGAPGRANPNANLAKLKGKELVAEIRARAGE